MRCGVAAVASGWRELSPAILDTIVAHAMRRIHNSATPRRPPLPMMFAAIWMGVRCRRDPIPGATGQASSSHATDSGGGRRGGCSRRWWAALRPPCGKPMCAQTKQDVRDREAVAAREENPRRRRGCGHATKASRADDEAQAARAEAARVPIPRLLPRCRRPGDGERSNERCQSGRGAG